MARSKEPVTDIRAVKSMFRTGKSLAAHQAISPDVNDRKAVDGLRLWLPFIFGGVEDLALLRHGNRMLHGRDDNSFAGTSSCARASGDGLVGQRHRRGRRAAACALAHMLGADVPLGEPPRKLYAWVGPHSAVRSRGALGR